MIPSPIYCPRCNGFTNRHKLTDDGRDCYEYHDNIEDCFYELSNRVTVLEKKLAAGDNS